jgi:regulator of sirC expression with transglutaminase-like and TPR domain
MRKLTINIYQQQSEHLDTPTRIVLDCVVRERSGTEAEIAAMLLEAEMHGNLGTARIHFTEMK